MPTYPLIVAQYDLQGHRYRSEHWAIAALETKNRAHIFQVVGNTDTFAYDVSTDNAFAASQTLCGGCVVGEVNLDQLGWITAELKEIPIVRNKPEEFDCQYWVIDALRLLRYLAHPGVTITEARERYIKEELTKEKERWEIGEETLEDRLFPESK